MNLLIAPFIRSTDFLSASEFCKIHPLVLNLFPVKIKQLPKADRVTNDPMILDIVRGYKIPFTFLPDNQSHQICVN